MPSDEVLKLSFTLMERFNILFLRNEMRLDALGCLAKWGGGGRSNAKYGVKKSLRQIQLQ